MKRKLPKTTANNAPSTDGRALIANALAALQVGDVASAYKHLQRVQVLDPNNPEVWHLLSLAHIKTGDWAGARGWLEKAVAARPNNATFWQNLGSAMMGLGDAQQAEQHYRTGLAADPQHIGCQYNLGCLLQNTGRLAEARTCFEAVLRLNAEHPGSLQNLATVLTLTGHNAEAEQLLRRLLTLAPNLPEALSTLGHVLYNQQRLDEAEMVQRQALALVPNNAGFLNNLGNTLVATDKLDEARALYDRALALAPQNPTILDNIGTVLTKQGAHTEALLWYDRALAIAPTAADTYYNKANALRSMEREADAIACYQQALRLRPTYIEALNNLGNAHKALGQIDEAEAAYLAALAAQPNLPEGWNNLALLRQMQHRPEDAAAAYKQALALQPNMPEAVNNLARTQQMMGQSSEAEAGFRHAITLKPDYAEAWANLGSVLTDKGELDAADTASARALALRPDLAVAGSNRLFMSNYRHTLTPQALLQAHIAWAQTHTPDPGRQRFEGRSADPHRRLRIGFVSADFRWHSVAFFFDPLLDVIDRRQFSVHLYADLNRADEMTEKLRSRADSWTLITGRSDEDVAANIRADQIDILFDLSGHSAGNRLGVFARRPAPVQTSWLGYPNTTGMTQLDWRLVDINTDPPGSESLAVEKLLRLPAPFLCYRGPTDAPPITPLPAVQNGYITFGSFNNLPKTTPQVAEIWAEILHRLPDSRLLLKSRALADPQVRAEKLSAFRAKGIADERITLVGHTSGVYGHLATYGQMDIGLDPFPYNGTTTTCEALWMGVPVITLAGDRHAARVGSTLLCSVNLESLVASDLDDYIRRALAMASDLDRLAKLRSILRKRLQHASLCDAMSFGRNFGAALRQMWQAWCADPPV